MLIHRRRIIYVNLGDMKVSDLLNNKPVEIIPGFTIYPRYIMELDKKSQNELVSGWYIIHYVESETTIKTISMKRVYSLPKGRVKYWVNKVSELMGIDYIPYQYCHIVDPNSGEKLTALIGISFHNSRFDQYYNSIGNPTFRYPEFETIGCLDCTSDSAQFQLCSFDTSISMFNIIDQNSSQYIDYRDKNKILAKYELDMGVYANGSISKKYSRYSVDNIKSIHHLAEELLNDDSVNFFSIDPNLSESKSKFTIIKEKFIFDVIKGKSSMRYTLIWHPVIYDVEYPIYHNSYEITKENGKYHICSDPWVIDLYKEIRRMLNSK